MRYTFLSVDGYVPYKYDVLSKKTAIYGQAEARGGVYETPGKSARWEIVCDNQPESVLRTMLELAKEGASDK